MLHAVRRRIVDTLMRFKRNDRAVAAVEFALIFPFLLTLYFGTIEASALFAADRRVNTISATMGDLVAQWDDDDGSIPVATMNDYFSAAQGLIYPMPSGTLKQVVSCVRVLADGTTQVVWSKGYNGGTPRIANTSYPLATTTRMNQVARGGYIIASETSYSYTPLLSQIFQSPFPLFHENLYLPRFGALISAAS
ncbi:MAG TPA: TadE/TadG family type IV pilus assembly protein [Devosia sp.]|nr:TadE/TadG family type IV pilus assembly protein [Devosia sp.]